MPTEPRACIGGSEDTAALAAARKELQQMEFKSPYLRAMRERAPKMFNQLVRNGRIEEHLQEKSEEAHRMFDELTKDAPKLQSGYPEEPFAREAEEQVFATLIEFPE